MTIFDMVSVICVSAAAVPVLIVWIVQQARRRGAQARLADLIEPMEGRQRALEARLKTLEAIVTDPGYGLSIDLAALERGEGQSPSA